MIPVERDETRKRSGRTGVLQKGIGLSGGNPEMAFGAALVAEGLKKRDPEHLQKALTGGTENPLLARNLVRHFARRGETIADLRARLGNPQ